MPPPKYDSDSFVEYAHPLFTFIHLLMISSRLVSDTRPLTIHTNGPGVNIYHVQKTFLASVSAKLATQCFSQRVYLKVGHEAFRIFLAWLLREDTKKAKSSQLSLARARSFGALYEIPSFQDKVMEQLIELLESTYVDPAAVLEAYQVTERDTLLQRALVTQLAIDMRSKTGYHWERKFFTEHGMEKVADLYVDLIQAMCDHHDDSLVLEGFLLMDATE
jgi:putative Ca2+/H+ antiporter (TMEM165/GDT1 family)